MRANLVCLSEVFSLTSHRKMAANINVTKRNTLPLLYNINSSTGILPQHQQYIYLLYVAMATSKR